MPMIIRLTLSSLSAGVMFSSSSSFLKAFFSVFIILVFADTLLERLSNVRLSSANKDATPD